MDNVFARILKGPVPLEAPKMAVPLKHNAVPQMDFNEALLISPVAQKYKKKGEPDSRRDYEDQQLRLAEGLPMCWDDSKFNNSQPGDLFGFWSYKKHVEIYMVVSVHNPKHRLPTWSSNVGQGDRNVIMLSSRICKIPWETWESEDELGGAKRCMGTASVKKNLDVILEYVRGSLM